MQGGPRIVDIEDVPWMEVSRIRLSDGRTASIHQRWIDLSPRFVCFYNRWDPGR
jgi:hypothetical protein